MRVRVRIRVKGMVRVKPKVKVRRYREGSKVAKTTYTDEVTRDWEYEWEGDMYVQGSADGKIPAHPEHRYQTRPMTQSRLFITYSLHRRVDSELEARKVLELVRVKRAGTAVADSPS